MSKNNTWTTGLTVLILLSVTALGAFLRFKALGDWSLWNDEIHTVETAISGVSRDVVGQSIFYPLNFILTGLTFRLLGVSEFSARLFPAVMGILTIPATYFLGKTLFNRPTGLMAALFLSLYTWHIDWSQNARYYALECLLVVISSWLFINGLEKNRWRLIILSQVFLMAAALSHPSAAFIAAAYVFYLMALLLFGKRLGFDVPENFRRNSLLFLAPFLAGLILLSPWYIKLPVMLLKMRGAVSSPSYILLNLTYHVQIPFLLMSFASGAYLVAKKDRRGIFLLSCLLIPLSLLVLASLRTLAYGSYVFYTLPFYCILSAYALKTLYDRLKADGMVIAHGVFFVMILALASSDYLYFRHEHGNRARWKEASLSIKQEIRAGDAVFATDGSTVNYYLGDTTKVYWLNKYDRVYQDVRDRRLWFLIYNEDTAALRESFVGFLHDRCRFVGEFRENSSVKNRDIRIYQCAPDEGGHRE